MEEIDVDGLVPDTDYFIQVIDRRNLTDKRGSGRLTGVAFTSGYILTNIHI
jgi:hypothetical protein